jgi:hypothetical protein
MLEPLACMGMEESGEPWKHFVFQFVLESGYAPRVFGHEIKSIRYPLDNFENVSDEGQRNLSHFN